MKRIWGTKGSRARLARRRIRARAGAARAALCLAPFALAACGGDAKHPPPKPPVVTVATATGRDVPIYLDSIGYATAFEAVEIMSQVDGQLLKIHFKQGSTVKKGELLFTIDPRPYQAVLERGRGDLETALARQQITQLAVERNRALLPDQMISPQAFDALVADYDEASGEVRTARGAVKHAEVNLDYCTIESPVDGVIDIYEVNAGNILFSADQTILTSVRQVDPIYIDFIVSERDLPRVQTHLRKSDGKLTLDVAPMTAPNEKKRAVLEIISNEVKRGSGTVHLRGTMPNPDRFLWPGQSLNVRLILDTQANAITIPRESLQLGQRGYSVLVVSADKRVERRVVTIGEREGDDTIIKTGLKAGENVVVKGQIMLRPGGKVRILGETTKPPATPPTTPPAKKRGE